MKATLHFDADDMELEMALKGWWWRMKYMELREDIIKLTRSKIEPPPGVSESAFLLSKVNDQLAELTDMALGE